MWVGILAQLLELEHVQGAVQSSLGAFKSDVKFFLIERKKCRVSFEMLMRRKNNTKMDKQKRQKQGVKLEMKSPTC